MKEIVSKHSSGTQAVAVSSILASIAPDHPDRPMLEQTLHTLGMSAREHDLRSGGGGDGEETSAACRGAQGDEAPDGARSPIVVNTARGTPSLASLSPDLPFPGVARGGGNGSSLSLLSSTSSDAQLSKPNSPTFKHYD
jgi:hypothetical protein